MLKDFYGKFRYVSIVDDQLISFSDFLLGISNTKGQIYDNFRKKNVFPLRAIFLDRIYTQQLTYRGKQYYISQFLALVESKDYQSTSFEIEELNDQTILFAMCLNPQFTEIKLGDFIMKKVIDPVTGEVMIVGENEFEKAISDHYDFEKQVNYLVETAGRLLAKANSAKDLNLSEMVFQEAKNRLLGKGKEYTWRDFYKGEPPF